MLRWRAELWIVSKGEGGPSLRNGRQDEVFS
jgi:hypothetical protein